MEDRSNRLPSLQINTQISKIIQPNISHEGLQAKCKRNVSFIKLVLIKIRLQLTWRCSRCNEKGIGAISETNHFRKCKEEKEKEHERVVHGFVREVEKKRKELEEIDSRFWSFVQSNKKY